MVVSQCYSIHLAARVQIIFYFLGLIIRACIKRYTDIRASVVSLPHSFRHYYRLCALSLISPISTIAGTSYPIVADVLEGGIEPWKGWADDHYAFSAV